ncbi:DNA internalization-related competence protein ComEC/Rec2 [Salinivibrio kushneri]|uniref:DNA internalization-related competence protein ComEC/Rec2 n=1 Tax=Salinivibrio kushneri TaxID=1908198 RepID=UPI0009896E24|nr:DNA internalization-related competence protein ComEC/Rec2 [Salinivibrio kushneri]OOE71598.1 DNA internalization-related competence protein ComEC/Rec2 [Salinivibrio kushneri]
MTLTFTLTAALAVLSLPWWPMLPPIWVCIMTVIVFVVGWKRRWWWLAGSALGLTWAVLSANLYQADVIHVISHQEDTTISGTVGTLFSAKTGAQAIIFDVDKINQTRLPPFRSARVRVYWQSPPYPKKGERWQLVVTFKPPYGRLNEAGFDAEKYYVARRVHAKARLKEATRLTEQVSWRQQLLDTLSPALAPLAFGPHLLALSLGEREWLTPAHWDTLTHSGLAHLMAISGLHIGLAYGVGWQIGRWARVFLPERRLFLWLPLYVAMGVASLYAALAGFALPTQRALIALMLVSISKRLGARISPLNLLQLTLLLVLLRDPFAGFSMSFWLSFAAVGALCMAHYTLTHAASDGRIQTRPWLRPIKQLIGIQLILLVGMLPLQLGLFAGISAAATPINLVAVPWVGMVTVPLVFVGLLSESLSLSWVADWVWGGANASLHPVMALADLATDTWLPAPVTSAGWAISATVLVWGLYGWRWHRLKAVMLVLVAAVVAWRDPKPVNWQIDVLDVGHGLAVLISKNHRAVLYDTGNRWQVGGIAQAVIAPILTHRQIRQLDGLILSHGDSDHDGGATFMSDTYSPQWRRASERRAGYQACVAGERWRWQGLTFSVLWPPVQKARADNDDSCVIRVSGDGRSLLLTGDIEASGEADLLASLTDKQALNSDIILVPHHGSASSSSSAFIRAVDPVWAVASTGLLNPWQLPSPEVKLAYQNAGITWLDTAANGQVRWQGVDSDWQLTRWRQDRSDYWYRQMFKRRPVYLDADL